MGFDWTTELSNGITLTEAFILTSWTGKGRGMGKLGELGKLRELAKEGFYKTILS
jgi:hypothetical protein